LLAWYAAVHHLLRNIQGFDLRLLGFASHNLCVFVADDVRSVEKMHIVWAPIAGSRRMKSPVYLFSLCILAGYGAIIVLLFVGRISHFRHEDGFCVIGLQHLASIPLIAYDL
jgi:hypothetical protein